MGAGYPDLALSSSPADSLAVSSQTAGGVGGACSSSDLVGGADFFPLPLVWCDFLGGIPTLRQLWQDKSSAVCPEYLKAVVTLHLAVDTPHVRMKRRTIAAGTSHCIERHTFVMEMP